MKCAVFAALFALIGTSTCCPLDCGQVQCAQDYDPFSCPDGTVYSKTAAICGCCPGCVRFKGPGESCKNVTVASFDLTQYYTNRTYVTTGVPPEVISDNCAPGLNCRKSICSQYVYNCSDPANGNQYWSPACDVDGSYKAVQCKEHGSDPRCFCYSKEGRRLFGFDWLENKDEMRCQCSRLVAELSRDRNNKDLTFHCSTNGNFEKLQCRRGMCYCADKYTGQPISNFVPETLWNVLPCYDNKTMGLTYLRKCDSRSSAEGAIRKEMSSHGTNPKTLASPPCDPDGSYAPKQCDGNQCFCRTRDNNVPGPYQTEAGTASEKNQYCYCARDIAIFREAGRAFPYACDNGGNYKPLQTIGDEKFCVDSDGFPIGGEDQCTNL